MEWQDHCKMVSTLCKVSTAYHKDYATLPPEDVGRLITQIVYHTKELLRHSELDEASNKNWTKE